MNRITSLAILSLLLAVSTLAQAPQQQHFNLGMSIDEFASQMDVTRQDSSEAKYIDAAARAAKRGKREVIQINADGARMALLFDKRILRQMEVTAGNSFAYELSALTDELGKPIVSAANLAVWDRTDGTRFTLTARQGNGVLLVAPTPDQHR